MHLRINGHPRDCNSCTVAALIEELGLNPSQIAIERNGAIVPKSAYLNTPLACEDAIEIVGFIGGG